VRRSVERRCKVALRMIEGLSRFKMKIEEEDRGG